MSDLSIRLSVYRPSATASVRLRLQTTENWRILTSVFLVSCTMKSCDTGARIYTHAHRRASPQIDNMISINTAIRPIKTKQSNGYHQHQASRTKHG